MNPENITPGFIKEKRKELNLTTPQLAKELGCSERFIAYRESGTKPIKRFFAYALIGLLKTNKKI